MPYGLQWRRPFPWSRLSRHDEGGCAKYDNQFEGVIKNGDPTIRLNTPKSLRLKVVAQCGIFSDSARRKYCLQVSGCDFPKSEK